MDLVFEPEISRVRNLGIALQRLVDVQELGIIAGGKEHDAGFAVGSQGVGQPCRVMQHAAAGFGYLGREFESNEAAVTETETHFCEMARDVEADPIRSKGDSSTLDNFAKLSKPKPTQRNEPFLACHPCAPSSF